MIYITRPSPEGDNLTRLLNQANVSAIHLPFFNILAGQDLRHLQQQLDNLNLGDMVIIVSPQVTYMIEQHLPDLRLPNHLRYFAIGKKSAELFSQQNNIHVDYPNEENSAGLLSLLNQQAIGGHNALILCGDNGGQQLSQQLKLQTVNVKTIACYTRQTITYKPNILAENIAQQIILITSVDHLLQLDIYCQNKHKNEAQLIVTSERIFTKAKQLNWQKVLKIVSANNQFLFKTMITLCHNAKNI